MVNPRLPRLRYFGSVALLGLAALLVTGCSDDGNVTTLHGSAGEEQGPGGTSAAGGTGGGNTGGSEGMLGGSAGTMTQSGGTGGSGSTEDAAADANGPRDAGNPDGAPAHYNHRVLVGTSHQGPISIIADDGTIEWQYDYAALGEEANDPWMLPNGDIVFPYVKGAQQLTKDKKVVWNYPAPSGSEIQSAVPLENGHFLIGEIHGGGIGYLRELDPMGQVLNSVMVDSGNSGLGTHGQWRAVRKTPQGTYLVTYIDLSKGRELDANGNKMREFPCGNFVAIRLPNLNTLIACGDTTRVIEVDPQDKIVWEANKSNVPGNLLTGFACGLTRLPNGNTIICSWPGHLPSDPHTSRCFEVTPDHAVAWELKTPNVGWVSSLQMLDPATKVQGAILR